MYNCSSEVKYFGREIGCRIRQRGGDPRSWGVADAKVVHCCSAWKRWQALWAPLLPESPGVGSSINLNFDGFFCIFLLVYFS